MRSKWTRDYDSRGVDQIAKQFDAIFDYEMEGYRKLEIDELEIVTEKAVRVTLILGDNSLSPGVWFPKSQIKIDKYYDLWCKKWIYDKKIREIEDE